jgi:hypothetical protein
METKICKKCNKILDLDNFYKEGKYILSKCKKCISIGKKEQRKKFPEKIREAEKRSKLKNKDKRKIQRREFYLRNRERLVEESRKYLEKIPKDELKKRRRRYEKNRRKNFYSILKNKLRGRIGKAIKYGYKSVSTLELLGCTIEFFKIYIENKFQKGMSWDNYGFGIDKWNLDHIVPCNSFNLLLEEEQRKCFHYTNYQPLWQLDNIRKGKNP